MMMLASRFTSIISLPLVVILFGLVLVSSSCSSSSFISAATVSKTIVTWSRQLRTCDASSDLDLAATGTTRFIYAVNDDAVPTSDNGVRYHNWRGTKNINLLDSSDPVPLPDSVKNFTIMSDSFPLPIVDSASTYYHCQGFKTNFATKMHVIRFTPQIDYNHSMIVHHIVLFSCPNGLNQADLAFRGNCYDGTLTQGLKDCDQIQVAAAWAVGGGPIHLPPQAGYPIYPGDSYWMLQIHYEHSGKMRANDSAGFLFHYTDQLRPNDAAALEIDVPISEITIPARSNHYDIQAVCPSSCQTGLPSEGITVWGSLLHTHLAGTQLTVEHLRNGVALPVLDENIYYDFNYQQVVQFPIGSKKILNGDSMRLTCTYNTMNRDTVTTGGLGTRDEMCIAYLFYYPANKDPKLTYTQCGSWKMADPTAGFQGYCNGVNGVITFSNENYNIVTPTPNSTCIPSPLSHTVTVGNAGTTFIDPSQFNPSQYSKSESLDDQGKFVLHWTVNLNSTTKNGIVNFAAEVATNGWIGLGISPSGSMIASDSMIGWVNDQTKQVWALDRFNDRYGQPRIDSSQDIFNIQGTKGMFELSPPPINPIYYNVPSSTSNNSPPGVTPKNNGNDDNSEQSLSLIALVGISLAIVLIIILIVAGFTVLAYRRRYSFAGCCPPSFSRSKAESENDRLLLGSVPLL